MTSSHRIKQVPCPSCKKEAPYTKENPFRPFCSERCQLIDLGAWASESYRVPLQNQSPDSSDLSVLPPERTKFEDDSE